MHITNPTHLVDEFKKSGEFDRLRRELLAVFKHSDALEPFQARVADIANQRLDTDQKLQYLAPDAVQRELMEEMDRFPIVERAADGVTALTDPMFIARVRAGVQRILDEDRAKSRLTADETKDAQAMGLDGSQQITSITTVIPDSQHLAPAGGVPGSDADVPASLKHVDSTPS